LNPGQKTFSDFFRDPISPKHRYCPSCKQIVEIRVLLEEYCQTEVHGIPAKKRQVICGTDAEGSNGCGTKWFTLELPEDQLLSSPGKIG